LDNPASDRRISMKFQSQDITALEVIPGLFFFYVKVRLIWQKCAYKVSFW